MLKPLWPLLLLLMMRTSVPVLAYPSGAPESVCVSMVPADPPHTDGGQNSSSPYSVTFSPSTYTAGGSQITVNLAGLCGNVFKGFLIQARRADTLQDQSVAIGSFVISPDTKQVCSSAGLTHTSRISKSSLTLMWKPPASPAGHVHFRVTFMQDATSWWANVKSQVLRVSTDTSNPTTLDSPSNTISTSCSPSSTPQTTVESPSSTPMVGSTPVLYTTSFESTTLMNSTGAIQPSTAPGSVAGQTSDVPVTVTSTAVAAISAPSQGISSDGCGITRGCYTDCNGGTCSFVISWTAEANSVVFDVQAKDVLNGNRYMSIGFSEDDKMGSDFVSDCKYINNAMTVTQSFNKDKSGSDQIATNSLTLLSGGVQDGVFRCRFRQPKQPTDSQQPDLNKPFHILFAQGVVDAAGVKSYHRSRSASNAKVSLTSVSSLGAAAESMALVKAHGSMMTIAWIFCASVGILIARYFKGLLPGKKVAGTDIWFQIHRALMVLTLALCVAAFIIIFIYAKAWSGGSGIAYRDAHAYLGVIVTFFVIVNPIMALFRPHPGSENRYIFNWAHWGVGTVAHILAVVTVYIGTRMGKPIIPDFVIYFVVAFTVVHVVVFLCLELIKWCAGNKVTVTPKPTGPSVASMHDEDRSDSYELQQVGSNPKKAASTTNSTLEYLKLGLFWGHFLVTLALTIVIVVYIGKA